MCFRFVHRISEVSGNLFDFPPLFAIFYIVFIVQMSLADREFLKIIAWQLMTLGVEPLGTCTHTQEAIRVWFYLPAPFPSTITVVQSTKEKLIYFLCINHHNSHRNNTFKLFLHLYVYNQSTFYILPSAWFVSQRSFYISQIMSESHRNVNNNQPKSYSALIWQRSATTKYRHIHPYSIHLLLLFIWLLMCYN